MAGDSEAKVVICGDADQRAKIDQVRGALKALEHLVVIAAGAGDADTPTLADVRERGRGGDRAQLASARDAVSPQDASTFIYTSGTTGPPKGCVLTHANFVAGCDASQSTGIITHDERTYLFLPLACGRVRRSLQVTIRPAPRTNPDAKLARR